MPKAVARDPTHPRHNPAGLGNVREKGPRIAASSELNPLALGVVCAALDLCHERFHRRGALARAPRVSPPRRAHINL
jgi:hypothetical protein